MTKKKKKVEPAENEQTQAQRDVVRTIKILLINKDMRPADLARKMGVTKGYVGQLFAGRIRIINVNTLQKIAEATDTVVEVRFTAKVGPNG